MQEINERIIENLTKSSRSFFYNSVEKTLMHKYGYISYLPARQLLKSIKKVDPLTKELERKATALRMEIRNIRDRRKRVLATRRYAKLVSRIEEIKKPTSLELVRSE